MNTYCNKLELPFSPLIEGADIFNTDSIHKSIDLSLINPDIASLIDSKGLYVPWIELFYRKPGNVSKIHTDNEGGDYAKINWIYGGKDSSMLWYAPKDDNFMESKEIKKTVANTEYYEFCPTEVKFKYCVENMSGPYLVQVGVPHQISNPLEERFCLCFVLSNKHDRSRTTLQQAQNLFSEFIV